MQEEFQFAVPQFIIDFKDTFVGLLLMTISGSPYLLLKECEKMRTDVIGRVSFANCDPLFHGLDPKWKVLPAPPSWLTGHLLRGECLIAPIPMADLARNADTLCAIDSIGIASDGGVGSVLLFGDCPVEEMRDIAVPTDSSTSRTLLPWLLSERGFRPRLIEMGPNLESMLDRCDGALLIGDRAIHHAHLQPSLVRMDLGDEWLDITGMPMVFGVFCARQDADSAAVNLAISDLESALSRFENDPSFRQEVIARSAQVTRFSVSRMDTYFGSEVRNRLTEGDRASMQQFATKVCGLKKEVPWWNGHQSEPVNRRNAAS